MVTEYDGVIGEGIPDTVNGWMYDPSASWNGDAWRNSTEQVSVVVFDHSHLFGTSVVRVYDDRVDGFRSGVHIDGSPTVDDDNSITPTEARELAVAWMSGTHASDWTHPLVQESVFNAPYGFRLHRYYVEKLEDIVIYERESPPERIRGQQLEIRGHRSTGNYTISLTEYGQEPRDDLAVFTRSTDGEPLDTAVDLVHVVSAKLLTTPV